MLFLNANASLFDKGHSMYMILSTIATAVILLLAHKYIKTQRGKDRFLKLFAILTVIIHYSVVYVDLFKNGTREIGNTMLFAIHPCNICMWLLLIAALIKDKSTVAYRMLAEFVFWAGTICGFIGILLNENYVGNGLEDYEAFKGLLSHSTMVLGAIYMLLGGYMKIRVKNLLSVTAGLLFFVVHGAMINALFSKFNLGEPNSMYLQESPFPSLPWLNTPVIGVMALTVCFILTALYEQAALKKEDRWYSLHRKSK